MGTLSNIIRAMATQAIEQLFSQKLPAIEEFLPADVTQSTKPQFGHYQCNSSLRLAKVLGANPRDVAAELVAKLSEISAKSSDLVFEKLEIAGPGFINIFIAPDCLSNLLDSQRKDSRLGVSVPKKRKKVIVEYSSPNIAKELHVGHLRSTIIGESLARVSEFMGNDVVRLNHVGDWGTQFGMLIAYMKSFKKEVLEGSETFSLSDLMQWYRASKKLFDEDEDFKKSSQNEVVALQAKDKLSIKSWTLICDISRKAFNEIYDLLGVKLQERGESFYNSELPKIVDLLEKKKMVTKDGGAKCVFLEGFEGKDGTPFPMIVQKSDGGYNYSTTDMAAIKHRVEKEKADRIVYVVDAGQSLHFQMVFAAAEKAGVLDPSKTKAEHVAFGVVLGEDGKKFKTRSGDTVKLIDLLSAAVEKAEEILRERHPEISDDELHHMAKVLGIDAVKYADLSCHRLKDYVFSFDRMLRFEGNTVAFLLYAYVRIQSIKRKVGKDISSIRKEKINLAHPSEIALAMHLKQFEEALEMADSELLPNRLTDYLYQLAEKFHAFFRDCRVEGDDKENSRLLLCDLAGKILHKGLELLGIETLEKM